MNSAVTAGDRLRFLGFARKNIPRWSGVKCERARFDEAAVGTGSGCGKSVERACVAILRGGDRGGPRRRCGPLWTRRKLHPHHVATGSPNVDAECPLKTGINGAYEKGFRMTYQNPPRSFSLKPEFLPR